MPANPALRNSIASQILKSGCFFKPYKKSFGEQRVHSKVKDFIQTTSTEISKRFNSALRYSRFHRDERLQQQHPQDLRVGIENVP